MAYPLITLDLGLLPPGRMSAPRIIGGAIEGGSSLSGISLASDVTAGGLVAVDYEDIQLLSGSRDRTLFFNRLMIALQGGIRPLIVPLMTDVYAPCADDLFATVSGPGDGSVLSPFSDTSTFSDTAEFSQPPVSGAFLGNANPGDATVQLTVVGGRALQGGEWFGVQHPTKSFRAYCVTDIDSQTPHPNGNFTASVAIRPPLRDVVSVDMQIDWWRPRCLMRVRSGADMMMALQDYWRGSASIALIEAF